MVLVKYNAKNVYRCCNIRLLPGVNDVDAKDLEKACTVPLFKWRVDNGIIEIIKPKVENQEPSVKELIDLMPHIYDVKVLKKHIKQKVDSKLVKEAKKQLKKIEAEGKEVEDEQSNQ